MLVLKTMTVVKATDPAQDLAQINLFTRRELTEAEVYTFAVRLCDDQPDRDYERFAVPALQELAKLFVGKPGIFDHYWSAHEQTARIYACSVEKHGNATCLMAKAYLLRAPENESVIAAIDGGILKEVSIGCALRKATCTICGKPYGSCEHRKGKEYDGDICYAELSEATDAYEFSFVAVPAQRAAGIVKGSNVAGESEIATAPAEPRNDSAEGASGTPHVTDPIKGAEAPDKTMSTEEAERARARLRLENLRFGG